MTTGKSDPYAVIVCHKELQKSKVIERMCILCQGNLKLLDSVCYTIFQISFVLLTAGTLNPIWDEHFIFNIDSEVTDILIKLFDKDDLRADDPLGNVV